MVLLAAPAEQVRGEAFNIGSTEQNYLIRDLAETVHHRLPRCEVTYSEDAAPDPRSYRVDFSKFSTCFADCVFEWNAERGADELATAYAREGLTVEDLETGYRYIRLNQLKHLLGTKALDDGLRWASA